MGSQIYLCSDLHLNHDKDFIYGPRGFKSVYEMNETIIKVWNGTVDADDDIYLLGDVMLGQNEESEKLLHQLKGKIHIVRGNHDTDTRMELYRQSWNVVEVTEGQFLKYGKYHFYLSHYPCLCSNYDEDRSLKLRTVSLCGHSHTKDPFADWSKGMIYHVEWDAHGRPITIDEIIENIKERCNK